MRILLLISTLGLGGAERQLIAWAEILQRDLGNDVCVASFDATRVERLPSLEALGVPSVIVGREHNVMRRIERVVTFARKNRPDVVHAFSFSKSSLALAVAPLVGARPAASLQGDGLSDMAALRPLFRGQTLSRIKYFTSNSHEAIARVKPHLSQTASIEYVPNVVASPDPEVLALRPKGERDSLVALAVARLDKNKRIDVFLEALALARRAEPRLTGVVVGDGPARGDLENTAAQLGLLPDGVKFLGKLLDPSRQYANADIFVHVAASEGTPNVVLEAMAMGLPVVATGAGDLRLIIKPGQNGLLVPFDDAASVSRCLVDLAAAPDLRARLGERARIETLDNFGVGQLRDCLVRFYSSIQR